MYLNNVRALGYTQITDVSASTGLVIPDGCTMALVKVSGAPVRFRDDGTAPTAAVGYPLAVGDELVYGATSISVLRFIQVSAGAVLDVLFYAGM